MPSSLTWLSCGPTSSRRQRSSGLPDKDRRNRSASFCPPARMWSLMTIVTDHVRLLFMVSIQVSEFKATCLSVIERVRKTGQGVLITKHGVPVAELVPTQPQPKRKRQGFLGSMRGTGGFAGDVVAPALTADEWTSGLLDDDKRSSRR
jgi:prevent-host-death family protein